MRVLLLAILGAATVLGTGAGCAHRLGTGASGRDLVVYVFNDSGTNSVPVTVWVDGVRVEERAYAPFAGTQDRGEIRLRLLPGPHTVRATVANLTRQTVVDREHCMCQVIYYDETTPPEVRHGPAEPTLGVEQIGWC